MIPNKINISERLETANNREEFGYFEANTIFSCASSKSAFVVLDDNCPTRPTNL